MRSPVAIDAVQPAAAAQAQVSLGALEHANLHRNAGQLLERLRAGAVVPYLPREGLGGFDMVLSYTGGGALTLYITGDTATTGQVQPWVYQQMTETFVLDDEMRDWISIFTPRRVQWHLAPADRLATLASVGFERGGVR